MIHSKVFEIGNKHDKETTLHCISCNSREDIGFNAVRTDGVLNGFLCVCNSCMKKGFITTMEVTFKTI